MPETKDFKLARKIPTACVTVYIKSPSKDSDRVVVIKPIIATDVVGKIILQTPRLRSFGGVIFRGKVDKIKDFVAKLNDFEQGHKDVPVLKLMKAIIDFAKTFQLIPVYVKKQTTFDSSKAIYKLSKKRIMPKGIPVRASSDELIDVALQSGAKTTREISALTGLNIKETRGILNQMGAETIAKVQELSEYPQDMNPAATELWHYTLSRFKDQIKVGRSKSGKRAIAIAIFKHVAAKRGIIPFKLQENAPEEYKTALRKDVASKLHAADGRALVEIEAVHSALDTKGHLSYMSDMAFDSVAEMQSQIVVRGVITLGLKSGRSYTTIANELKHYGYADQGKHATKVLDSTVDFKIMRKPGDVSGKRLIIYVDYVLTSDQTKVLTNTETTAEALQELKVLAKNWFKTGKMQTK